MPNACAKLLANDVPTSKEPIRPGPRVNATALNCDLSIPERRNASETTGIIFFWCARDANSGTTPPYIS
ncbi:MAG: hypothetical protein BWX65_00954 [Bacteroidetes bacterium ADurb.Bin057]|nr:MAG: hypothetical protein BWX65_00954 [Bacteroidetes bacterium ADurb.Bin057]